MAVWNHSNSSVPRSSPCLLCIRPRVGGAGLETNHRVQARAGRAGWEPAGGRRTPDPIGPQMGVEVRLKTHPSRGPDGPCALAQTLEMPGCCRIPSPAVRGRVGFYVGSWLCLGLVPGFASYIRRRPPSFPGTGTLCVGWWFPAPRKYCRNHPQNTGRETGWRSARDYHFNSSIGLLCNEIFSFVSHFGSFFP